MALCGMRGKRPTCTSRLFGAPHTWATVRAALCGTAGELLCPKRVCPYAREALYHDDSRWATTARDAEYEALFPSERWPAALRQRVVRNEGIVDR